MSDLSSPVTGCHLESDPGVSPGTKKKRGKGALSLLLSLGKQRKKAPAGTLGLLVFKYHQTLTVITICKIGYYGKVQVLARLIFVKVHRFKRYMITIARQL